MATCQPCNRGVRLMGPHKGVGGPDLARTMQLTPLAREYLAQKRSTVDTASCAECGDVLSATGVWRFGHKRLCSAHCTEQAIHGNQVLRQPE